MKYVAYPLSDQWTSPYLSDYIESALRVCPGDCIVYPLDFYDAGSRMQPEDFEDNRENIIAVRVGDETWAVEGYSVTDLSEALRKYDKSQMEFEGRHWKNIRDLNKAFTENGIILRTGSFWFDFEERVYRVSVTNVNGGIGQVKVINAIKRLGFSHHQITVTKKSQSIYQVKVRASYPESGI